MKYTTALFFLLTASCSADWLQEQQSGDVYYPGMVGMANVGDYIRVESLDANGEVNTMEALPGSDVLSVFHLPMTYTLNNYAKILSINTDEDWRGTFILSFSADWSQLGTYQPGSAILDVSISHGIIKANVSSGGTMPSGIVHVEQGDGSNLFNVLISGLTGIHGYGLHGAALHVSDPSKLTYYLTPTFGYSAVNTVGEANTFVSRHNLDLKIGNSETIRVHVQGRLTAYGETWNAPTLLNGWTNYPGWDVAEYRKMPDGRIEVKGLVQSGTLNTTIFTLPATYRPHSHRIFSGIQGDSTPVRLDVLSTGEIRTVGATVNAFQSIELSFYP